MHRQGHLDEFYPNEAQLGATAIVAWAMSETYLLIKSSLTVSEEASFLNALTKSGSWLCRNDEKTNLANHQSQAMLAIYNIHKITNNSFLSQGLQIRKDRVLKLFHGEGWFEEYDRFDSGYLTTNLSFICRYWKYSNDESFYPIMLKCLDMLRYFFLPDYRFGGIIGSRNTKHCWPSSFEILTDRCDYAKSLAAFYRHGLHKEYVFNPSFQDRYFVQQLYDYLWSYKNASVELKDIKPLPFLDESFQKYFKDAGILAIKNSVGQCMLINVKKGGVFHYCRVDKNNNILSRKTDSGIAAKLNNGRVISTDYYGREGNASLRKGNGTVKLFIRGRLYYCNYIVPNPFTFSLFRLFNLTFGQVSFVRKTFRYYIARMLVMHRKRSPVNFEREIIISKDKVDVTDYVEVDTRFRNTINSVFFGGVFANVYTPYSKGFEIADLYSAPKVFDNINNSTVECKREL